MAPCKGSTNTRGSPNVIDNNNNELSTIMAQMEQLMGIIQGYMERTNVTLGMVVEMKKMFEEKQKELEKKNTLLKDQMTKKDKIDHEQDKETQIKVKKEEEDRKHKMNQREEEVVEILQNQVHRLFTAKGILAI